jgi:transcriptional regulator with XRE-family HTH domain
MSTIQKNMKVWRKPTESCVTKIFTSQQGLLKTLAQSVASEKKVVVEVKAYSKTPLQSILLTRPKWKDKEYRDAYMEASIEQGIAWQIKINRTLRSMTQEDLAKAIGTQQSAISRLEDPTYGAHSLDTLMNIAKTFDCALAVKFVSYSQLAYDSERLGEAEQYAVSYDEESKGIYGDQKSIKH